MLFDSLAVRPPVLFGTSCIIARDKSGFMVVAGTGAREPKMRPLNLELRNRCTLPSIAICQLYDRLEHALSHRAAGPKQEGGWRVQEETRSVGRAVGSKLEAGIRRCCSGLT